MKFIITPVDKIEKYKNNKLMKPVKEYVIKDVKSEMDDVDKKWLRLRIGDRALEIESIRNFNEEKKLYFHPGNNKRFWKSMRRKGHIKPGMYKAMCRLIKNKKEMIENKK